MAGVMVLNGPNLGRWAPEEPEIYGTQTLADIEALSAQRSRRSARVAFDSKRRRGEPGSGCCTKRWMRPDGRYSEPGCLHALLLCVAADACAMVTGAGLPLIEVHLSNPHTREEFRHTSVISGVATGVVIAGFGARFLSACMLQR
jgi:3-dehydroquinate dehydratase II